MMTKVDNRHRLTFWGAVRHFTRLRPVWFTITLLAHIAAFIFSFILAIFFRLDCTFSPEFIHYFYPQILFVVAVKVVVFYFQRHFKNRWFYASVKDLRMIVESAGLSLLILSFLRLFQPQLPELWSGFEWIPVFSRSVLVIDFITTIMTLGGMRLFWRFTQENVLSASHIENLKRAFFVGANPHGGKIVEIINSRKDTGYYVVGFLTRHSYKVRMQIAYTPILGMVEEVQNLAAKHKVKDILICAGTLDGVQFRNLYDLCQKGGLSLQVIPANDFVPSQKIPIREIDINDLLRREPVKLDTQMIRAELEGKRILVTGAGGSIGSEICRQLLTFHPKELILLGRGENRIFFLQRELQALGVDTVIKPVIANVTDPGHISAIFDRFQPQVVYHAAAHKHVPLMEENVSEAVYNNIYGTSNVATAADRIGVGRFVLISTDKAVNPTSVMGTTKHLAERVVNAIRQQSRTKFIVTRFGNVLGSAGSVIPIFKQQIQSGGPITITDRRMVRFFMTIPEAAQLVLEASALGNGGEIFVLDMGTPVKIVDLAHDMIRLAGLPEDAIEIRETGVRPGEKLFEELYFDSETKIPTKFEKLFAANHRSFNFEEVQEQVQQLFDLVQGGNDDQVRAKLKELVPEYHQPK